MQRDQVYEVMHEVMGRGWAMRDLGAWVSMKCPLAPWTHERGHDNSPSFGISVNEDGVSIANCFSCHYKNTLSNLIREYAKYTGDDFDELADEVEEGEFLGPSKIPSWEEMKYKEEDILMPIDEGIYMDLYDSAVGHPYLKERGISKATTRKLELLYDPKDPADGQPRILFPVRGPDGLLYGFSGRATSKGAKLKVRDYAGLAKKQMVLGSHLAADASKIILVEGLVDYASVHEMGEVGCAIMHSAPTEEQANILKDLARPTYFVLDNDQAGRSGTYTAARMLVGHMPLFRTQYPRVRIEDDSEQGWHWLKDPGELTREELQAMIDDAHLV